MHRVAEWLAGSAHDVHRSLLPVPSPEKIRWAMEELGADASPPLEAWLRMTGGQDWANAPDGALPPYFLLSLQEVVWNTQDLRAEGTLPPRAAAVIGYNFDEAERFLLMDSAGLLWELDGGRIEKVAGSAAELIERVLAERPSMRGWLADGGQSPGTFRLLAAAAGLAIGGVGTLALAARSEGFAEFGWGAIAALLIGLLARSVWHQLQGRAWSRALVADLASAPDEPWKANAYWRRAEAFPLDAGAPPVNLAEVPLRIGVPATVTVPIADAEARLESVQILTGPIEWDADPLEEHSCDCRHETGRTVLTLLIPDTWPTRLPGHYSNRAVVWQLTVITGNREYRYWLPVFDD